LLVYRGGANNSGDTDNSNPVIEKSTVQSPVAGTVLSSTRVVFNISANGADEIWISLGDSAASESYFRSKVTGNSIEAINVPQDGSLVYLTLSSLIDGEWQTSEYQYLTLDQVSDPADALISDLGMVHGNTDLVQGTQVSLKLMDASSAGNNLRNLATYSITIDENMGAKDLWPWYLAQEINANSQYIQMGQLAANGAFDTLTPVKQAMGNNVYSIVGEGLYFEVEILIPEIETPDSDSLNVVITTSQNTVLDDASITVSGEQSAGLDIQNANYAWVVESGQATITSASSLQTEVVFDQQDAEQVVVLKLTITSGGQVAEQTISIEHNHGNDDITVTVTGSMSVLIFALLMGATQLRRFKVC
jgi:hypothetical protein